MCSRGDGPEVAGLRPESTAAVSPSVWVAVKEMVASAVELLAGPADVLGFVADAAVVMPGAFEVGNATDDLHFLVDGLRCDDLVVTAAFRTT